MKLQGFRELEKELKALQNAAAALDGDIAEITCDANDPSSIDSAMAQINAAVDERVRGIPQTPTVKKFVSSLKEKFRQHLLDKALETRTKNSADD